MTPPTNQSDESARTRLIEIAARLTDRTAAGGSSAAWLRAFRKNYRHIAVTYGLMFSHSDLDHFEKLTDAALDSKASPEAA